MGEEIKWTNAKSFGDALYNSRSVEEKSVE